MMSRRKLLYLGFEFWPGQRALPPQAPATGHIFQAELLAALQQHFEVRFASLVPEVGELKAGEAVNPQPLYLLEKWPVVLHRFASLRRLKRQYKSWQSSGWEPDVVLFYNLAPIFCPFIRWLGGQQRAPKRVLLLADSNTLGMRMPRLKRLRYRLKPFAVLEDEVLPCLEGCISLSQGTEGYFSARKTPWFWMPGGCKPERALPALRGPGSGPVQFGYFGRLAAEPGVTHLLNSFQASRISGGLHIWGYGKLAREIEARAQVDGRIEFHGQARNPDDYLKLAQACDVLVNPRPLTPGNMNNFPSKLFAYALSGRAIMTTGFGGAKEVLGSEAFYLEESKLEASLVESFERISRLARTELQRRGGAIQERVVGEYSWTKQALRIESFLQGLLQ